MIREAIQEDIAAGHLTNQSAIYCIMANPSEVIQLGLIHTQEQIMIVFRFLGMTGYYELDVPTNLPNCLAYLKSSGAVDKTLKSLDDQLEIYLSNIKAAYDHKVQLAREKVAKTKAQLGS